VDNKEEARRILPPAFRSQAKIVSLNKFSMEEIDDIVSSIGVKRERRNLDHRSQERGRIMAKDSNASRRRRSGARPR